MGTLHEMVTWDKKHFGEWKRKQWCKKNKEIRSLKKLISFLFKLPLHWVPYSKAFLYHGTTLYKGPMKLLNIIINQIHFNAFGTALEAGLYPRGANIQQCSYQNFSTLGSTGPIEKLKWGHEGEN